MVLRLVGSAALVILALALLCPGAVWADDGPPGSDLTGVDASAVERAALREQITGSQAGAKVVNGPQTRRAPIEEMRIPAGFRAAAETAAEPYTDTGWAKEIVHEATGIELAFIPVGEFMMGSRIDEAERYDDEGPQHRVRITKPFYMGKYEVTQTQWQQVMGNNPSNFKDDGRLPVETVSWDDIQGFLSRAGDGLRLPTEAEWEYACRAGTPTPFHFGSTISTSQANYDGDYAYRSRSRGVYREKTMPVGSFSPNAWGLYDMHGNVWEWCADWYGESYYGQRRRADLQGPASGQYRVLRGGSWCDLPNCVRSAVRNRNVPTLRRSYFGFRVVLVPEQSVVP